MGRKFGITSESVILESSVVSPTVTSSSLHNTTPVQSRKQRKVTTDRSWSELRKQPYVTTDHWFIPGITQRTYQCGNSVKWPQTNPESWTAETALRDHRRTSFETPETAQGDHRPTLVRNRGNSLAWPLTGNFKKTTEYRRTSLTVTVRPQRIDRSHRSL